MGLFKKFRTGLRKTQSKLVHELRRIVTRSPRLTGAGAEELEAALIAADLGVAMTAEIMAAVKKEFETQGGGGLEVSDIARREVERSLASGRSDLNLQPAGVTVVSLVGVNGTGKTTTAAKLAFMLQSQGKRVTLAACDTFRAAAIEQLKLWGERLQVPVVAGADKADPASVAHDALSSALARQADFLIIDTAGRLHTKNNLMQELQKLHRVLDKKLPGAPHEILLVLDGSTGMNAVSQAREFHKSVKLTGLVVTKLDGSSKGGVVVAIQRELGLPVKFVGLGEKPDDLQPFDAKEFAEAMFFEDKEG